MPTDPLDRRPRHDGTPPEPARSRWPRSVLTWLILIIAVILLIQWANRRMQADVEELSLQEFYGTFYDAQAGRFRPDLLEASLDETVLTGRFAAAVADQRGYQRFRVQFPERAIGEVFAELRTIKGFKDVSGGTVWLHVLLSLLPWIVLILLVYFLFFRQVHASGGPGGILSFGKSRARLANRERPRVTFDDVAGIDEAKDEVLEIIEFLKSPEKFQRLGGRIPRGVMLIGAPGTGKTLLAKAIAGEADVPFFSICGSDFVEMFVGVGASRVRDLFRQAKENSPCIIFLDEVDAVGRRRGAGQGGGHDEREQTLNAILVEMDGFDTNEQVILIAATNRPDVLDPALLRPGRFDREVVIDLPDVRGRLEILKVHARNVRLDPDADLQTLARSTPTFSGADLAAIINESALQATMAGKDAIETEDLEEARDKVRWGRAKRRVMDEYDKRLTAYHEAGHTLVAKLDPDVEPLHKVTIIPRGMSLGATMMLPERDRYTVTRRQLAAKIRVALGGRIAEEIFCDDVSNGAASDIENATEIARRMVCDWGMSDQVGPVRYGSGEQQVFLGGEVIRPREHSEATAELIDREVKTIVDRCYQDTRQMVLGHRDQVRRIAEALIKYEVLGAEDVDRILEGGQPVQAMAQSENDRAPVQGDSHSAPPPVPQGTARVTGTGRSPHDDGGDSTTDDAGNTATVGGDAAGDDGREDTGSEGNGPGQC